MCECFVCVSALVVFVVTLTTAVSCCTAIQSTSAVYLVRRSGYIRRDSVRGSHIVSIRTGLKSRLVWDWSAVIHTITFSKQEQATIVYVYIRTKMGRDLVYTTCSRISFHYYQTSYDTCRGTNLWPLIGSTFAKNSWKLDKGDKTRCTWPFQAKNRYDVMLANRRASGVWFVLGFRTYLFLAHMWPCIPVFGKNP